MWLNHRAIVTAVWFYREMTLSQISLYLIWPGTPLLSLTSDRSNVETFLGSEHFERDYIWTQKAIFKVESFRLTFKSVWQGTFSELIGLGVPDGRNRVCKYSISSSTRVRLCKKQNNLEMNLWENWQECRWQGSLINHVMKKAWNVW